jgi:uncharacterized protein DUF4252
MKHPTPILLAAALLVTAMPLAAHAQAARLNLPEFKGLADKATDSVDISLDGDMLKQAAPFMSGPQSKVPAEAADALKDVKGIYVRVFEFKEAGVYSEKDLDGVRSQLQAPGWKKLMSVQSKDEHVDMYLHEHASNPDDGGMALVVSEPKEFVIVNIVGAIDLEKLRQLQGKFGVPALPGIGSGAAAAAPKN